LRPGWQPGQSGNPAGRPKGSRNKLAGSFVDALYHDFKEHGPAVIAQVRQEKPDQYLKVVASILPREFIVKDETVDHLTDEQLVELVDAIHTATAAAARAQALRQVSRPLIEGEVVKPDKVEVPS
jgi:hypothetical protein